jgi:geranylgeranyl pyrophosphate synthase
LQEQFPQILREKLRHILQSDPVLGDIFPLTGNLERAKFSRGRLLYKMACDNQADLNCATEAAVGLELVHLATLIHDDVIDDADLRRDRASFRSIKGDRAAILFGDYLFSAAIRQIQATQKAGCAQIFTDRVFDTCRGESIQDLSLTWDESTPSVSLLQEAARGKTGALFAFCTESVLWMIESSEQQKREARECGFLCGLAFQLADDLLDIAGSTTDLGKPSGNDLIKNTMTMPLFLFMQAQGMNWSELRTHYGQNTAQLVEDYFASPANAQLQNMIQSLQRELFGLGDSLEKSGIKIQDTLSLFWAKYVQSRIDSLKDARP